MPTAGRALDELAIKVARLKQPEAYSQKCAAVDAVETHLSWVFLTETTAYKLRKPTELGRLGELALRDRRARCDEEVRLNQRLAADVYRGASPLLLTCAGIFVSAAVLPPGVAFSGAGDVIDWLVTMRRLPRDRTLDRLIRAGSVDLSAVRRAARVLSRFYERSIPVPFRGDDYRARLRGEVLRYRRELDAPRLSKEGVSLDAITSFQLERLRREPELFDARARAGRIIDAHGDLRPEHIFLTPEPVIIDCLEQDRELRILDAASELAFLDLECDRLAAPDVGRAFLDEYQETTGDAPPEELIDFYESHHACIRAVVALWHTEGSDPDAWPPWIAKARAYLRLAARRAGAPCQIS